jgi:hypothetical protein
MKGRPKAATAKSRRLPDDPEDYLPTLDEIRSVCLEIQEAWSEEERLYRAGGNKPKEWLPPGAIKRGFPGKNPGPVASKLSPLARRYLRNFVLQWVKTRQTS